VISKQEIECIKRLIRFIEGQPLTGEFNGCLNAFRAMLGRELAAKRKAEHRLAPEVVRQIQALRGQHKSVREIATEMHLARATVRKYLKPYERRETFE
jgi:hypothetical protein